VAIDDTGPVVEIEFLYWAECPSHEEARAMLSEVLADTGIRARVTEIEITNELDAGELGFPGSPTIRVNGHDVAPLSPEGLGSRLTCRVYVREDRSYSPLPSREMIRRALTRALESTST
jgi:hypothetical protein